MKNLSFEQWITFAVLSSDHKPTKNHKLLELVWADGSFKM